MKKIKETSFLYIIYLFFWPFRIFEDVNKKDLYACAAAWRKNREQLIHVPMFLLKWIGLATLFLYSIHFFENISKINVVCNSFCAIFGILFTFSILVIVQLVVVSIFIKRFTI